MFGISKKNGNADETFDFLEPKDPQSESFSNMFKGTITGDKKSKNYFPIAKTKTPIF